MNAIDRPLWDVVVVGAGAAGVSAAFHAQKHGARVLLLSKGLVGRGGATVSSGGRIAVSGQTLRDELGLDGDATDTRARFGQNIRHAGGGLGDEDLAQVMIDGVGGELKRLADAGVKFPITQGGTGRGPGSSVRVPGPDLQRVLNQLAVDAGVRVWEDFQAVRLIQQDGRVTGVLGIDRRRGGVEGVEAKAVVLATGGSTSNWRKRDTPEDLFGEGQAMALKAGAALVDMEFIQFLACCVVNPPLWRGHQFPWRLLGPPAGVQAWLLNRHGERFMAKWAPETMEFAPEAVIAKAMAHEIAEGRGTASGAIYLSWAHLPQQVLLDLPNWSSQVDAHWNWQGHAIKPLVDSALATGAIEVAAAAHFCLGGVKIDVEGWSGTPGLFACGEAAGGLHGADRLQGAAVAQALAQGKMSGVAAARAAASTEAAPTPSLDAIRDEILAPLRRAEGIAPFEVKRQLTGVVDAALGPLRSGPALATALEAVRDIQRLDLPRMACRTADPVLNRDWSEALECEAAALVMEAALLSAQARLRSIGSHQRLDDPGDGGLEPWNGVVILEPSGLVHRRVERKAAVRATASC